MSLNDGVLKGTVNRSMRPAYVYVCRLALRGSKKNATGVRRHRNVEQPSPERAQDSLSVIEEDQVWFGDIVEGAWEYLDEFNGIARSHEGRRCIYFIGRPFWRPFLLFSHASAFRTGLCFPPSTHQLPTLIPCGSSLRVSTCTVCQSALRPVFRAPPSPHTQDFSTHARHSHRILKSA